LPQSRHIKRKLPVSGESDIGWYCIKVGYRIIYEFLIFHTRAIYSTHEIINDLIISVLVKFLDEYEIWLTIKGKRHFF